MKLSNTVLMISAMASTAAATMQISSKSAAKVLRAANRRVEEDAEEEEEGEYDYLMKYTLKMVGCKAGEKVVDAETGEYEYNAAVFRLCPSDGTCSDDSEERGCDSNYGEFVVGLSTYVESYFEDQADNMNWDDAFDGDKYAKCEQYEVEMDDDAAAAQWEDYAFYIGPTCTEEGGVKLALFQDDACTYESEITFETISNGWTLPYSDGGLVSTNCIDCGAYNDDGEYELREMCEELYEGAGSKCETNMEYFSYYGQNVAGCEYITELMPAMKSGGSAGKVFGWIVFIALIGGLAGYIVWWRKSKSDELQEPLECTRRPKWWQRIFGRRTHR
jgi:hypothetical protein